MKGLQNDEGSKLQLRGLWVDIVVHGTSRLPQVAQQRDLVPGTIDSIWHICLRYNGTVL